MDHTIDNSSDDEDHNSSNIENESFGGRDSISNHSSFSSPIRHSYRDNVEEILDRQKARSNAVFHPLSSPVKGQGESWKSRGSVINRRNKHNKLKEIREHFKNEKLMNNREKITNQQATQDYNTKLNLEADNIFSGMDANDMIEFERQEKELEEQEKLEKLKEEERLQLELEDFLMAEQQELEQLVANLEL